MAHDQSKKNAARQAYIYKALDLKEVSNMLGLPYSTVRQWKNKAREASDDWDAARSAARMGANGLGELTNVLIENFALQSEALLAVLKADEDMPAAAKVDIMTKLSDGYSKLVSSAAKSGTKVAPLSVAMRVLQMLGDFVETEFPQHAPAFLEILQPFGAFVAKEIK